MKRTDRAPARVASACGRGGMLLALMAANAIPPAHAQWREAFGSPASILAGPIQATLTFIGDDIASSGNFRRHDSGMDARINLQRFQFHPDLATPSSGPLADWQWRGAIGYSDLRARTRFPEDTYGVRQSSTLQMISVGVKGSRNWEGGLYALFGLGLHVARFHDSTDFGSTPYADQIYIGLNRAYINTTIRTASVTARIGTGVRQALDRERRFHGIIEASILPIYTRTLSVEASDQHFSRFSTSLHLRTGIEWSTGVSILNHPVTVAPSYSRRQFFDNIRPLDAPALNEVSLDLLLAPSYRHQALEGLGLGFSWMKSGDWTGFRIQLKGVFG